MAERRDLDGLTVRHAAASDLDAINRIYNQEVLHGTATWDEEPWSIEQRRAWFEQHDQSTPVLVAELDGGVVGFAHLSLYRPKVGYRFTRENTVYVEPGRRGRGVGRRLLEALLGEARHLGVHAVIAVIEAENAVSIRLHERLGFELIGTEREVGFKFGRWLDSVYMELLLGGGDR
jgi:phosphinothricin acetyltransferase